MRRVTQSTLNRLAKLEAPRAERRGGVIMVPRILSYDDWEREAMASQPALSRATMEGTELGGVVRPVEAAGA